MCCDDYDVGTLAQQKTIKARKPHRCYECGKEIPKGAEYENYKHLIDGKFEEYHTCLSCVDLRNRLMNVDGCRCWLFGGLYEDERRFELEEVAV